MFIDASAFVALLAREEGYEGISSRFDIHGTRITSPLAVWESTVAIARLLTLTPAEAMGELEHLCKMAEVETRPVPPEATALAIGAWERFGKGRHPAGLYFGDCFSYACAKHYGLPLLYKGGDFALTDIEAA